MKPSKNPLIRHSLHTILVVTFSALPAFGALSTWDGGAGAGDTNINTGTNWAGDATPTFNSVLQGLFQTTTAANINTNVTFGPTTTNPAMAFGGNFTMNAGSGIITLYGSNTGGTTVLRTNSGASSVTINAPIEVFATSPAAAPFGGLLVITVNNGTSTNTALNIAGGLSKATTSTAATYDIRFGNNVTPTTTVAAKAKISGPISGLGSIVNGNPGGGQWTGDFIIAGDQSLSTSNINIASGAGFGTPQATARLVLGESNTDDQTWNNITLSNVMNLAIGGNVSANVFSGNTANTKITGASATGNISFNSGTIGANVALGGAGTNENDLSITKKGTGTLNINSTSIASTGGTTYTGATTVEAGTLNISSATSLASPITVKAGATLGGEGLTSQALTFDPGTSTLSFDPATTGSFTAGGVTTTGATIIANPSAATTIGQTYTVLTRSAGNFNAAEVAAFLGGGRATIGGTGTNTITYTADAPASLTWKGNDGTNPSYWDVATTFNWTNGVADRFFSNDAVTFDDTASSFAVVIQGTSATPGNMVFNHSANNYTISGGTIVGTGSLTKSGSGTLTLAQASGSNSFSGALNINGGTLSISSLNRIGGGAGTRPIQLGGGTLEYTYTASNAETTDSVPLILNPGNSGIKITGSYVTGSVNAPTAAVTLRLGAPITGSGNLEKSGTGILSIGKNSVATIGNTFTGTLSVTAGALDIRNPDSLGATSAGTTLSNAQLELFSFNQNAGVTFDAEPITVIGSSFIRSKNEDVDSDILHVLTGTLTVNPGSVVGISSPKAVSLSSTIANTINSISPNISSLELSGAVTTGAGSILKLGLVPPVVLPVVQSNAPQTVILSGALTGSGAVETQGAAASLFTLADPEYSGNTTVNGGTLSLGAENSANNASTVSIASTGAKLDLNFTGTDTVQKLFIGGVQQPAGVYKASDNITDAGTAIAQISGTGTLTVTSSPSGFSSWATTNGIPGALPGADADSDGLTNLTEYALGTSPTAATPSPGIWSGNTITFNKGADAITNQDVNYIIETSTDLGVTDPWTAAVTQNAPNASSTITYTFTPGSPVRKFARLKTVLIP